jgi:hypothetical protein
VVTLPTNKKSCTPLFGLSIYIAGWSNEDIMDRDLLGTENPAEVVKFGVIALLMWIGLLRNQVRPLYRS